MTGVQPRPLRRARRLWAPVVEVSFCRDIHNGEHRTRAEIKLGCEHVQRMTLASFNRRGPWKLGRLVACGRAHAKAPRFSWRDWQRSRGESRRIIDEMNRRTSRELLAKAIRKAARRG